MNEPHDIRNSLLLANLQAAIDTIRATHASNLILAPGNHWFGGHSWTKGGYEANNECIRKLVDSLNNLAIDVHKCLDEDFSGSRPLCCQAPVSNLVGVTA
jgi:Cellulase (glycosyl hydrolase family 5).